MIGVFKKQIITGQGGVTLIFQCTPLSVQTSDSFDIDKLDDSIADEFVERWNSEYSHEAIDSLNEFVRNILRWGCG